MTTRTGHAMVYCLLYLGFVTCGWADDEADVRATVRAELDRAIQHYELTANIAGTPQPLVPIAVHRWTNNQRDPQGQAVAVIWTYSGRPYVVGGIYPWRGNICHELELVSVATVRAADGSAVVWAPSKTRPALPLPGAGAPEDAPAARLRQMKMQADRFTMTMKGWAADDSDHELLRRLPRELYRYQPETPEVLDGAVFAFVQGTDPEALLLIEAVKDAAGYQWQYLIVRQTSGGVQAALDGQEVWVVAKHVPRTNPNEPFITVKHAPTLNAVAAEGKQP